MWDAFFVLKKLEYLRAIPLKEEKGPFLSRERRRQLENPVLLKVPPSKGGGDTLLVCHSHQHLSLAASLEAGANKFLLELVMMLGELPMMPLFKYCSRFSGGFLH